MKGVILTTAIGEYQVKESVEEILKRVAECGETGHLMFTIANTKDSDHEGYKASCIAGLYRAVREIQITNKDQKK